MIPEHVIQMSAEMDLAECEAAYEGWRATKARQVLVDASRVVRWPTARVAFLTELLRRFDRRQVAWSLNGVPEEVQSALDFFLYRKQPKKARAQDEVALVESTLDRTVRAWRALTELYGLLQDITFWSIIGPFMRHGFRYGRSMYEITERGVRSLPIVALVTSIMGLILAMTAAAQLKLFGAQIMIANLVGISVVYELGPLLAAVLVAGRCGSAITAEIGSMVTSEEMDALRAMGISITKYIVVPKFVALVITLPCLTVFGNIIANIAAYVFAVLGLGLPSAEYLDMLQQSVTPRDVSIGLIKSVADAIVIAVIAVREGLTTRGGAEGIGRSTTQSVVRSIVGIAGAHLFFTALYYATGNVPMIKR